MRIINLKTIVLFGVMLLLSPVYLIAQYQIYTGQQLDHTYLTVKEITGTDSSTYGAGYVISSTTKDFTTASTSVLSGEIMRTNPGGAPYWTGTYIVNGGTGTPHRFNHIEKFTVNGVVQYLVVGSIDNGGQNTLLVAIVDDNGSVVLSQEYMSANFPNIIGIKGIAVSDNTFAIIGMESTGYDVSDQKNIVVLKLDSSLALIYSMMLSSPNTNYDHDTPADIVEGASPDEFFVVGTSNKDVDFFTPNSLPCAFAVSIDIANNMVFWSYNHSTAYGKHWDGAADSYYDGNGRFWMLANSSVVHYYNLTELDVNSGAVLKQNQFTDSTYGNDFNHYGYELKPSLNQSGHFVIGGWKGEYANANNIQPFLVEIDPDSAIYIWQWKYNGDKNLHLQINDNAWLTSKAAGQFPYCYNDMMTYRPNGTGYAMLTTDTTYNKKEDIMFWYATDIGGNVSGADCGYYNPLGDSIDWQFIMNSPLDRENNMINAGIDNFLTRQDITYSRDVCHGNYDGDDDGIDNGGDGSDGRMAPDKPKADKNALVSPNPMDQENTMAIINLEADNTTEVQVAIYDMLGKQYYNGTYTLIKGKNQLPVDLSNTSMAAGMYTIKISSLSINKNILLMVK